MGKMKKVLLMMILGTMLITGCGAKNQSYDSAPMEDYDNSISEESVVEEEVAIGEESSKKVTNQKLVHRASMNVEVVHKLEPLIQSMQKFIDEHEGYVENMEQYRSGQDPVTQEELETVAMTIRIPHKNFDKALQTISELGTVVNKNSSVEDVTLQYSDIESTLKMYKVEQERLFKMLEKDAADIKDIIEIEKRLSEVRVAIEKYESARRALESLIGYDTIELEIRQVRRVGDERITKTFGNRIQTTFGKSIDGVVIFFQGIVLIMTYMAIPIIIMLIIAGIIYIPVSKLRKRRKAQKLSKKEDMQTK